MIPALRSTCLFVMTIGSLFSAEVFANCTIKILPMGRPTPTSARSAEQIRFPTVTKYAVLKQRSSTLSGDSDLTYALELKLKESLVLLPAVVLGFNLPSQLPDAS